MKGKLKRVDYRLVSPNRMSSILGSEGFYDKIINKKPTKFLLWAGNYCVN